jgi:hypothetical protein
MDTWEIKDGTLEYLDDEHIYLYDGLILPSITQILQIKFGKKYDGVDTKILNKAAQNGTKIHKAIENLCKTGEVEDYKEVKNFMFLQKHYDFKVIDNEVPVVLFKEDVPIAAGRLDLVLEINNGLYLGDIKRTSALDKEYLGYQLNLYRIAYQQCYGKTIKGLRGIHLREDKRKFVPIPIKEDMAWELIEEYMRLENENRKE